MDRELPLGQDSGDGNRGHCPAEPPRGSRRPTGLTSIANHLRNRHRCAIEVGGNGSPWCGRPLLRRRPWMGSNWKGRESGGQETRSLCSGEHRVGKQARPPVQHWEDGSSTLHTQERPQEAPPAKTHSKNQGGRRLLPVQQRSDMVAGSMDGCPPNFQRASQLLHEEGQGSRRPTARTDEDARNRPRAGMGRPCSLRLCCRTIRQRIIVRHGRNRQMRGSSTPPQSASQVNPGGPAHDSTWPAHKTLRTDTCASSPRLQAATICGEACK